MPDLKNNSSSRAGFWATLAAFAAWGLLPAYWKAIADVPAVEILCHRILWSAVFLAIVLSVRKQWYAVGDGIRSGRIRMLLCASSVFLCANWLIYIWAVNAGFVLETSLGYYITPLLNVLSGYMVFGDRLRRLQWVALALAAGGVAFLVLRYGQVPWIALGLALSFALYGLVRKLAEIDAVPGLFLETLIMTPFAAVWLLVLGTHGEASFLAGEGTRDLLLAGTGVVTSVPLLWFAYGARRISLVTVGFLQFLSPSIAFLLGVFAYHEPFSEMRAVAFGCIWAALAFYTAEGVIRLRAARNEG